MDAWRRSLAGPEPSLGLVAGAVSLSPLLLGPDIRKLQVGKPWKRLREKQTVLPRSRPQWELVGDRSETGGAIGG